MGMGAYDAISFVISTLGICLVTLSGHRPILI